MSKAGKASADTTSDPHEKMRQDNLQLKQHALEHRRFAEHVAEQAAPFIEEMRSYAATTAGHPDARIDLRIASHGKRLPASDLPLYELTIGYHRGRPYNFRLRVPLWDLGDGGSMDILSHPQPNYGDGFNEFLTWIVMHRGLAMKTRLI